MKSQYYCINKATIKTKPCVFKSFQHSRGLVGVCDEDTQGYSRLITISLEETWKSFIKLLPTGWNAVRTSKY